MSERVPGGFAAVYKVLVGVRGVRPLPPRLLRRRPRRRPVRHRRRDRPAAHVQPSSAGRRDKPTAVALAATDPANPYGAALPWPDAVGEGGGTAPAARPAPWSCWSTARLTLYVERGGRTLLTWTDDADAARPGRRGARRPPSAGVRSAGSPSRRPTASQLLGAAARRRCARRSRPPASSPPRAGLRLGRCDVPEGDTVCRAAGCSTGR